MDTSSSFTIPHVTKDGIELQQYLNSSATLPNGTLMTLENDQSAQLVCTNDEWMYSFNFYNIFTVPLVTASCVLAGMR